MKTMILRNTRTWMTLGLAALLGLFCLPVCGTTAYASETNFPVRVDEVNFPDPNFRAYVLESYDDDQSGDLSEEEIADVTSMHVRAKQLRSLKGIEYFTSLIDLFCEANQLTELDISKNQALLQLVCRDNELTVLDVSKNPALQDLDFGSNQLTELDISSNENLKELRCYRNPLMTLDLSNNPQLERLDCSGIELTELDVSKNPKLLSLDCAYNKLTELDVSRNPLLELIYCNDNQLTSLTLGKQEYLSEFDCSWNWLESLDVSQAPALIDLRCAVNLLKSLDVSKNTRLDDLDCFRNKIQTLNLDNNRQLISLDCGRNRLSALDTSHLTALEEFYCEDNVLALDDFQLDMAAYDKTFDSAHITDSDGLLFDEDGYMVMQDGLDTAWYYYDTGNGNLLYAEVQRIGKEYTITDVEAKPGNWKYDSVKYVTDREIMGGVGGSNQFLPDDKLSRSMFATVLYRAAGEPYVEYQPVFSDVPDGKWYSKAILWANEQGIVSGYTDGSYGIDDNITREQIAKMLYLYGASEGYDLEAREALDTFTDKEKVSAWAVDYIRWAVAAKMISGKPNGDGTYRLDPKGDATRAECAKMLMMFMERHDR